MKREITRKVLTIISGMVLSVILLVGTSTVSLAYTQAAGIVSADAAKVRKEPSTESDVVAGLLKGSTVTVVDEVTDSAGTMWYKVSVEGSTGYIRSDLLLKANVSGAAAGTTTSQPSDASQSKPENAAADKPAATTVKAIAETKAYVNFESARVREGASTKHEIVGSAVKNTPVTITGEAKATDGKLWYQVKYNNTSGREVVGFIRSDLLTIGEPPAPAETPAQPTETAPADTPAEGAENTENTEEVPDGEAGEQPPQAEQPAEEPEPEVVQKPDYEMVFTENNEGIQEWYLYDNINGTRQTLAGLMAAAEAATKMSETNKSQTSTQKIIIIVLAIAVAVLAVVVTLLIFKLRDMYDESYEDYEDEDEEDEEEDEEPVVRKKRTVPAVKQVKAPVQTAPVKAVKEKAVSSVKKAEYQPEEEELEAGGAAEEKPQPKRKAKNFLIDDDEFEFEFLNMDDKN